MQLIFRSLPYLVIGQYAKKFIMAFTVLCSVVKQEEEARKSEALNKRGETRDVVECFFLHFFRDVAASCALCNRIEHSHDKYMSCDEAKLISFLLPLSYSHRYFPLAHF